MIGSLERRSQLAIGELIIHLRTQHGLTQYELADQLAGVSGNDTMTAETVWRWERGRRIPGPYWRSWLGEVLGPDQRRTSVD